MMQRIRAALPHINIVLSLLFLTLVIIDHFNNAMQFIENDITKTLLFIFAILVIWSSVCLIILQRRAARKNNEREK